MAKIQCGVKPDVPFDENGFLMRVVFDEIGF